MHDPAGVQESRRITDGQNRKGRSAPQDVALCNGSSGQEQDMARGNVIGGLDFAKGEGAAVQHFSLKLRVERRSEWTRPNHAQLDCTPPLERDRRPLNELREASEERRLDRVLARDPLRPQRRQYRQEKKANDGSCVVRPRMTLPTWCALPNPAITAQAAGHPWALRGNS